MWWWYWPSGSLRLRTIEIGLRTLGLCQASGSNYCNGKSAGNLNATHVSHFKLLSYAVWLYYRFPLSLRMPDSVCTADYQSKICLLAINCPLLNFA